MIRLLSLIGRATIVIAAILIVVTFTVTGYQSPELHPYLADYGFGRPVGAVVGFAIGLVTAGIIFGPLATLYDIRDNVRHLAKAGDDAPARPDRSASGREGPPTVRREPRLT
jgi:hypothetical protein